jgi:hypothetical protein
MQNEKPHVRYHFLWMQNTNAKHAYYL